MSSRLCAWPAPAPSVPEPDYLQLRPGVSEEHPCWFRVSPAQARERIVASSWSSVESVRRQGGPGPRRVLALPRGRFGEIQGQGLASCHSSNAGKGGTEPRNLNPGEASGQRERERGPKPPPWALIPRGRDWGRTTSWSPCHHLSAVTLGHAIRPLSPWRDSCGVTAGPPRLSGRDDSDF